MKKLVSIFLVFLIAFNAGGYIFVYFQLESCFKKAAFNRINDYMPIEELELIKVCKSKPDASYDRLEDREFMLHGKMYDIYQEDVINDSLYIYCVNDENEDMMHSAFSSYINAKKNDSPNSAISNIIKILMTIALEPAESNDLFCNTNKNISIVFLTLYKNIIIDIPSPPPKSA